MGTSSSRPHCQVREAPLSCQGGNSSHGGFMQALPWTCYPSGLVILTFLFKCQFLLDLYGAAEQLSLFFFPLSHSQTYWTCVFILVTLQCSWIPEISSLIHLEKLSSEAFSEGLFRRRNQLEGADPRSQSLEVSNCCYLADWPV